MPRPLKPKPVPAVVAIALALKQLGYDPIPLRSGKSKPFKGWPTMANDEAAIKKMVGRTVALRTNGCIDAFFIDIDVQDEGARDKIVEAYRARWPEFFAQCVIRHSGGIKVMLIGRLITGKKSMHSARWGVSKEFPQGHRVELFTANDHRYCAVWGLHSVAKDGTETYYGYDGPELVTVARETLPWFLDADLHELIDIADRILAECGFTKDEDGIDGDEEVNYLLEPDMQWKRQDGSFTRLDDLERELTGAAEWARGWPNLWDPKAASRSGGRVKAKVTPGQGLLLWDGETEVKYRWKHLGPQADVLAPLLKKLADDTAQSNVVPLFKSAVGPQVRVHGGKTDDAPPYPADGAPFLVRLKWLLHSYAYCAVSDCVVDMYEASSDCELKPAAFERRFAAWYDEVPIRGGVKKVPATNEWAETEQRIHVAGARLQPGATFPLFDADGKVWKNTYRRPVHAGVGGDIGPFLRFLDRFIPDPVERAWLLNWMAYKWRHPEIPGIAIVFVADDGDDEIKEGKFGTGRGFMFKIAHHLYGRRYARSQSFSILDGSSSQSTYNDWLHGSVLVTVDESKTSATAHRRGERKSVYEILKDIVDPAPKLHRFNPKGRQAFDGMSYCSLWLASNHDDAVAIPAKDRRFTVLRNGAEMTDPEIAEILEWMTKSESMAALVELLEARDLSGFNMFRPLATVGKAEMVELGRTQIEDIVVELQDDEKRGLVFTRQQLMHAVEDIIRPWERRGGLERRRDGGQWHGEFAAAWRDYCVGLKTKEGTHWKIRIEGRQVKLYCFRKNRQKAVLLYESTRRAEAAKWGGIVPLRDQLTVLKGGADLDEKDE